MGNSMFLTTLDFHLKDGGERIYVLDEPLVYYSNILNCEVHIPTNFETDLASVPRIPLIYSFWGGRANREGVLHDYLFRIDSVPVVPFGIANDVFIEAMKSRNKSKFVSYPMYWGVCIGGKPSYHKKLVSHAF